jgi:hypothetical protein
MVAMPHTIQADESGALVVPAGVAGDVRPGERFTVEPCGDAVILRRENPASSDWRQEPTPQEWVASLERWLATLPASPPVPLEATRRDSLYD